MNDPIQGALPEAQLRRLEDRFPARVLTLADGSSLSVRSSGPASALPLVCLHGIGSGSASWLGVAECLGPDRRLIAWDAPGYGDSSALPMARPEGVDYAARLGAMLDALGIERCVLVGHSLGALMAAPAAAQNARVAALVLISPAQGYGAAGREADRARVRSERLATLEKLGIAGLARSRSDRLVSEHASTLARQWVRWNMARLNEGGYRQAIELLCGGRLLESLDAIAGRIPVMVACGEQDVVTPPASCEQVARRCGVALERIADAGHASYVERPEPVAQLLAGVLEAALGRTSVLQPR